MTFVSRCGDAAAILLAAVLLAPSSAFGAEADQAADPVDKPTDQHRHRADDRHGDRASRGWWRRRRDRLELRRTEVAAIAEIHGLSLLAYTGGAPDMTSLGFGHGPSTHYIEPGYSLRVGDPLGEPVGVAVLLDIGPSLAFVERTLHGDAFGNNLAVDVPGHATLGGRASVGLAPMYRGFRSHSATAELPIDAATALEGALFRRRRSIRSTHQERQAMSTNCSGKRTTTPTAEHHHHFRDAHHVDVRREHRDVERSTPPGELARLGNQKRIASPSAAPPSTRARAEGEPSA
jgi:hypothetical protein